jgi:hypothetical protein
MRRFSDDNTTRREFVKQAIAAGVVLAGGSAGALSGARPAPILINHLGYLPKASKFCLQNRSSPAHFTVVDTSSGAVVWSGKMKIVEGDFGTFGVGDFSPLNTNGGLFQVHADGIHSESFVIGNNAYANFVQNGVNYFSIQRCGNSTTGYNAPCHIDDGRRLDDGKHQDVSGGWHDACDLRKWVDSTIYGMVGLSRLLGLYNNTQLAPTILDELRWGNLYFRKMQASTGYILDYCGGDDGNYFTDNIIGTRDDRPIHTNPAPLTAQFHFIGSQATLYRYVQPLDTAYAHGCLEAALQCLTWATTKASASTADEFAAAAMAMTQLFIATQSSRYQDLAADYASRLISLQQSSGSVRGFFQSSIHSAEPYRNTEYGDLPLLALCDLLETFPNHPNAPSWLNSMELHCNLLVSMAGRSGMGIVPYGFYGSGDPGGNRTIGSYWYRWFMEISGSKTAEDYWLGINGNLASTGIGLSRAAAIANNPAYSSVAQRQLDWIVGCNPFDASTVLGAGYNQPTVYHPTAFSPATPVIDGAVMNGIGGTKLDEPDLYNGSFHTCEYYTPMVAYTTWLMAELQGSLSV